MIDAGQAWTRVLLAIVVLRAILAVVLWHDAGGYFWLTGDDAARTQLAYIWSQQPFFNVPGNVWLPLGIWLHGLVLTVVDDPLAVSAAVNSAFSIGAIVVVHRLTTTLFPERPPAAALAAAIAGFCPLLVWLGLSGLSEAIFHFFMLAGIYFWVLAFRDNRPQLLPAAALGLMAASMIRLEAWVLVGLFDLYCLLVAIRTARSTSLASALLASLFVPVWLGWHWWTFGDPVSFLQVPDAQNAGGLAAPDFSRFVVLLWDISPPALVLAMLGITAAFTTDRPNPTRRGYALLIGVFFVCFALVTRGRLAANMPIRNLTGIYLLLVPFSAYALARGAGFLSRPAAFAIVTIAAVITVGAAQSFGYRFQASDNVVRIATWTRRTIRNGALGGGADKILIEARRGGDAERLVVWDSLFLRAVHPGFTVYDRRPRLIPTADSWVIRESGNPSLLEGTASEVRERLRSRRVRFVVAYSAAARDVIDSLMTPVTDPTDAANPRASDAAPLRRGRDYAVYEWPEDGRTPSARGPS